MPCRRQDHDPLVVSRLAMLSAPAVRTQRSCILYMLQFMIFDRLAPELMIALAVKKWSGNEFESRWRLYMIVYGSIRISVKAMSELETCRWT